MKCDLCGTKFKGKICPNCGLPTADVHEKQPGNNEQNAQQTDIYGHPLIMPVQKLKKPIYKKWWFWVIIAFVVIDAIGSLEYNSVIDAIGSLEYNSNTTENGTGSNNVSSTESNDTKDIKKAEVTVVDFSSMDQAAIQSWADTNKVTCEFSEDYSDSVAKGSFVAQSANAGDTIHEGDTIKIVFSLGKKPPVEYTNALEKAETYSKTMHMSKKKIYDHLTSDYGEQFSADAAQYAIDNVQADWNANALEQAKLYQTTMSMSKSAIYDLLISEYVGQFTKEQAQYAIDHLDN